MDGPDHQASIEPSEFEKMVTTLRKVEKGLGDGIKRTLNSEQNIRDVAMKSLVYQSDLTEGHVLSLKDLAAKRPGNGLPPNEVETFVGRILKQSVIRNEQVAHSHVSG